MSPLLVPLVSCLLYGLVALVWAMGVSRIAGPVSPALWARLLSVVLVLPPVLASLPHTPDAWAPIRADLWAEGALHAAPVFAWTLAVLLAGTAALFAVQEAWPALVARRGWPGTARRPDARIDAALARVVAAFRVAGVRLPRGLPPRAVLLDTDARVAALVGITQPIVVVSQGLIEGLDDEALDAVVAHEVAHLVRGGNRRLFLLWGLRALQAPSPSALVAFRGLTEAQETACDALAARVTGRPAALAAALLAAHGKAPGPAVERRTRALLDAPGRPARARGPRALAWTAILLAAVVVADRAALGPRIPDGWFEAEGIESVPEACGQVLVPSYLPDTLAWPPARVLCRVKDGSGWWLDVRGLRGGETRLWIGTGGDGPPGGVTQGWRRLSAQADEGRTVHVLANLDGIEALRVLEGLGSVR